jgi:hypothetical protein
MIHQVCHYCGEVDNFNIDADGREYCFECGHYTGYREEEDEDGYYWVDEENLPIDREHSYEEEDW